MKANFDKAVAFTFLQEGGYANDPRDPGKATNMGITIETLSEWRGTECTDDDVMNLTKAEATEIYHAWYWNETSADSLPSGLDLMVFDFGVTSGPATSVERLQRVVGVVQDGHAGPMTLRAAACSGAVLRSRITSLGQLQDAYYHSLPGYAHDGPGWLARTARRQAAAMGYTIN